MHVGARFFSIAVAVVLATASCGDDSPTLAPQDAPGPPAGSFTAFVFDLVQNHTNETESPVAFDVFKDLPDPDDNNPHAYDGLFP